MAEVYISNTMVNDSDGTVAYAEQIKDTTFNSDGTGEFQSVINQKVKELLLKFDDLISDIPKEDTDIDDSIELNTLNKIKTFLKGYSIEDSLKDIIKELEFKINEKPSGDIKLDYALKVLTKNDYENIDTIDNNTLYFIYEEDSSEILWKFCDNFPVKFN